MKKLLFVVSALAAFSLLAPSSGFAQWENKIGIYTTAVAPESGGTSMTLAASTPTNIYFVLTNPMNGGQEVQSVEAFEFKVAYNPSATFFKLAESFPVDALNVGTAPEYVVGYASPVAVGADRQITLMTWQCMILTPTQHDLFIELPSIPSLAGSLAYQDADALSGDLLVAATSSSNDYAAKVFSFNPAAGEEPIATENESFGNVKALFR
jgi:hypothetical protein